MKNISATDKPITMTVYAQAIWNDGGFWEVTTIQTETGVYYSKPEGEYTLTQSVDNCKIACGDECVIAAALLNANGMDVQACLGMDDNPIVD